MTQADEAQADAVIRQEHGAVAILTLNRPRQRNALVQESWTGIARHLDAVAQDGTKVVVITGSEGFFSAGGDRKIRPAHGRGPLAPAGRLEIAQQVMAQIRTLPLPVIACVDGGAIGIAWSLALSCDMVVAARNAYFSAPFVHLGLPPDGGGAWLLVRQLGRAKASDIILRSKKLTAEEASLAGLVAVLAEPGEALPVALEVAEQIAEADPHAVELAKRLLSSAENSDRKTFDMLELAFAATAQRLAAGR